MYVIAHNPTAADVVIDDQDSVIPAGQWGVVVSTNIEVAAAAGVGHLDLYPFGAGGSAAAEEATNLARHLNETGATVLRDKS